MTKITISNQRKIHDFFSFSSMLQAVHEFTHQFTHFFHTKISRTKNLTKIHNVECKNDENPKNEFCQNLSIRQWNFFQYFFSVRKWISILTVLRSHLNWNSHWFIVRWCHGWAVRACMCALSVCLCVRRLALRLSEPRPKHGSRSLYVLCSSSSWLYLCTAALVLSVRWHQWSTAMLVL